jgi:outer membrane protein, multidrug efflux system
MRGRKQANRYWFHALGAIAIGLLASCEVGPNYQKPRTTVAAAYPTTQPTTRGSVTSAESEPSVQWWRELRDTELDSLVDRAATGNFDLQIATSRVLQARATLEQSTAGLFPTVNGTGTYYWVNNGKESSIGQVFGASNSSPQDTTSQIWVSGLDPKWQLDVFGGLRRQVESSQASEEASEENRHAVIVSVVAEVALDYLELRGSQQRMAIAQENLKLQEDTLGLTNSLRQSGFNTELDVSREESQVAQTRAEIVPIRTQVTQLEHAIATLLGEDPDALKAELDPPAAIPQVPPVVLTGMPADLLRRRPDIRQAERNIAADNALIGVAVSNYYPKFSLSGDFGFDAGKFKQWFDWESHYFILDPGFTWDLLDFGRTDAQVKLTKEQRNEAFLTYQNTVLTALREVEDALTAYANEQDHRAALADAVASAQEAVEISRDQYKQGVVDFLQVLDAQRQLLLVQDQLVQSDQAISTNLVALYKALGGGWEVMRNPDNDKDNAGGVAVTKD